MKAREELVRPLELAQGDAELVSLAGQDPSDAVDVGQVTEVGSELPGEEDACHDGPKSCSR